MWRSWAAVVVVAVACGHPDPESTTLANRRAAPKPRPAHPAAAAEPAPCAEVATNVLRLSRTTGDTKPLTEMMRQRCAADLWSIEARTCYLTATSWDDALACEPKLSDAQVKSLEDDIKAHGSVMGHPPPQP